MWNSTVMMERETETEISSETLNVSITCSGNALWVHVNTKKIDFHKQQILDLITKNVFRFYHIPVRWFQILPYSIICPLKMPNQNYL